jgi:hypothetical protein
MIECEGTLAYVGDHGTPSDPYYSSLVRMYLALKYV